MTDEQLDEIEKLAEAWIRHEHFSDAPPLAKRVLPLVKALREARVARDKYKSALDAELPAAWREDIESLNSCLERIGKERDEARALLAALKEEHRPADEIRAQLLAEIEAHAETKAEVERLREAVRQVHALAEKGRADWPRHTAWGALVDIHKITKGMVE